MTALVRTAWKTGRPVFLLTIVIVTGLAALFVTSADSGEPIPEVTFLVFRLDSETDEVRHAYRFVQPLRKSLPPEEFEPVADFFIDFKFPSDLGYTEIHSRLTGRKVYRARSVFGGTGRLEWPTEAEEVTGVAGGSTVPEPTIFSWRSIYGSLTEASARDVWMAVRDLDLVASVAQQGAFGVFVFDHPFDVYCACAHPVEREVIVYARPDAPQDVGLTRQLWPRSLIPDRSVTLPEVNVHNFSDEAIDVDVEVELRSEEELLYSSIRTLESFEPDTSVTLLFDEFRPPGLGVLSLTTRLRAQGGGWSDAFPDNDSLQRSIEVTDRPVFRVIGSERMPGTIPRGEMLDFDGDGDPDVIQHNVSPTGFWQNDGEGTYIDITESFVGLVHSGSRHAYSRDFTGDGLTDVLFQYWREPPVLLQGDGTGAFQNITLESGLTAYEPFSLSVLDVDGDQNPDIVMTGDRETGLETVLLNDGAGHFTDGTVGSGLADNFSYTSMIASGFIDADDLPDLVFANGTEPSSLYRNLGGGRYSLQGTLSDESDSVMAVIFDSNRDGINDVFVTRGRSGNGLYRQEDPFSFIDVSTTAGKLGERSFAATADIDRDGWMDLLLTSRSRLLLNKNGVFLDHSELLVEVGEHGSLSNGQWIDFDADGDLDIHSESVVLENVARPAETLDVAIDIMPGDSSNTFNPSARGVIRVALLGSESYEINDVDGSTLEFGPGRAPLAHGNGPHRKDVNGDGLTDLVLHFRTRETALTPGVFDACLYGETIDEVFISGCDSVERVPPPNPSSFSRRGRRTESAWPGPRQPGPK